MEEETVKIYFNDNPLLVKKNTPSSVALYSNGVKFVNRSLKYYRPRGIISLDTFNQSILVNLMVYQILTQTVFLVKMECALKD